MGPFPLCGVPSSSVHSRYQRHVTDLPWGRLAICIRLIVRKFSCRNSSCGRRIFTKHPPELGAVFARKTNQLITALQAIGVALGGNTGARLAARLRLPSSAATLLRLVRAAPIPPMPALQAVGVDEWAWRLGHRYGTILVDLASHRVVDLLPDRSGASVAAWLAQHPTTTTVCRDRSDLYADGIRRGHPTRCKSSIGFISSITSARPRKHSYSTTDRRSRWQRYTQRWRSRRPLTLYSSRPCTGDSAGALSLRSRERGPGSYPGMPHGS